MKTLFLDFDGVLHTMTDMSVSPFGRLPLLADVLVGRPVHIVVSSSWRHHFEWSEIRQKLGVLAPMVVGCTGEAILGVHARYHEILHYAEDHGIADWRALDDAWIEFPEHEKRLILCNPRVGVDVLQLQLLDAWLNQREAL